MLFLDLDRQAIAQLRRALQLLSSDARTNGFPMNSALRDLLAAVAERDRNRHEPTGVDATDESVHVGAMTPSALLTLADAASRLGVSKRTVERLVGAGEIPTVLLGRARRIRRLDLDDYIDSLSPNASFRARVIGKAS